MLYYMSPWPRKGDYEVHNGCLIKFNWTSRRKNWDHVRVLTAWEKFALMFGVFPNTEKKTDA